MAVYADTGTTSTEVATGGTLPNGIRHLCGFNIRETGGAAAIVEIHDGTSSSGARKATVSLNANQATGENYPSWVSLTSGHIFVNIVSGTVRWIVYFSSSS